MTHIRVGKLYLSGQKTRSDDRCEHENREVDMESTIFGTSLCPDCAFPVPVNILNSLSWEKSGNLTKDLQFKATTRPDRTQARQEGKKTRFVPKMMNAKGRLKWTCICCILLLFTAFKIFKLKQVRKINLAGGLLPYFKRTDRVIVSERLYRASRCVKGRLVASGWPQVVSDCSAAMNLSLHLHVTEYIRIGATINNVLKVVNRDFPDSSKKQIRSCKGRRHPLTGVVIVARGKQLSHKSLEEVERSLLNICFVNPSVALKIYKLKALHPVHSAYPPRPFRIVITGLEEASKKWTVSVALLTGEHWSRQAPFFVCYRKQYSCQIITMGVMFFPN